MPFIRYGIGDSGNVQEKSCSCGIKGLIFEEIHGRSLEFLKLPNDKKFPLLALNIILESSGDLIHLFQLIIKKIDEWILNVIPRDPNLHNDYSKIQKMLSTYTNGSVNIDIQETQKLIRTKGGKLLLVINGEDLIDK